MSSPFRRLASPARPRLRLESLEARDVPATFTVTNLNDAPVAAAGDAPGTLRQAIFDANALGGADAVAFQAGLTGTLTLNSGQLVITGAVTVQGPGARTIAVNGNAASRIFYVNAVTGDDVTISGLTVTNGSVPNKGGAIRVKTGDLTIDACAVTDSTATVGGGGIYLNAQATGEHVVRNSTLSGNTTTVGDGGGLYFQGGSLLIENTTVSNNTATDGGGVESFSNGGTIVIRNSTIAFNTAKDLGGGFYLGASGAATTATVISTIIANNTANTGPNEDVFVESGSGNVLNVLNSLILAPAGGLGVNGTNTDNLFGVDPGLAPLADNGGPTQTHAITGSSAAVNAGSNPGGLAFDQRGTGFGRTAGTATDIGAFESQVAPAITSAAATTFEAGNAGTFTVTTTGFPAPSLSVSGTLPDGVTFVDNGDGTATLSGTPNRGGAFALTITASNGASPDATQVFTLTVNGDPVNQNAFPLYTTSGEAGGVTVRNPDGSVASTSPNVGGAGSRGAVADVNGDGVADTVVANGPGARTAVTVFDGATGGTLRSLAPFEDSFTGGAFVAAGDVDGDGFADLAVSADTTGGARVTVYSGADGSLLADFFGIDDPAFRGGARVAVGDVNGDGLADLIVAAGTGGGPRIAVYDGVSLRPGLTPVKLVNDFFAFEQTLRDGAFVSAGDVNGDGRSDLIFGGGPGGGPRVLIWNSLPFFLSGGAMIDPLADFYAADPSLAEGVRVAAKDLDGDAFSDLVVGVPTGTGSTVTTYLGKTITPNGTPPVFAEFDAGVGGVFVG